MKTTISLFLILIFGSALGQNLVPNGDFEGHGDCSEGTLFSMLYDWYWPEGGGSSDYFNACSNVPWPNSGVPSNIFGFEAANSGEGYAGFGTYQDDLELIEYLRVELTNPLEANQEYCISFFLSWADSSSYTSKFVHVLFKDMDDWIYEEQDDGYADLAQVVFDDVDVVDGNGWKFFSKSFTALGGERFMTIGNFFQNQDLAIDLIEFNQPPYRAYYFIDDVEVSLCSTFLNEEDQGSFDVKFDPFTNSIYWDQAGVDVIQVADLAGRVVLRKTIAQDSGSILLTHFSSGIYLVTVFKDKTPHSIKIKIM